MSNESEYWEAIEQRLDKWVVACAGTETPFRHGRNRWLYLYNPATGKHGYLNLDTDVVEDDYRLESESPFVHYLP